MSAPPLRLLCIPLTTDAQVVECGEGTTTTGTATDAAAPAVPRPFYVLAPPLRLLCIPLTTDDQVVECGEGTTTTGTATDAAAPAVPEYEHPLPGLVTAKGGRDGSSRVADTRAIGKTADSVPLAYLKYALSYPFLCQ